MASYDALTGDADAGRRRDDGRWEILLGVSVAALVVVTLVDAVVIPDVNWRLAVLAAAVAVVADRCADARTALGGAVGAWAMGNGFLEHHGGTLNWHSRIDFPFVLGLLGAAAVGMCTAESRAALRRRRQNLPGVRRRLTVAPPISASAPQWRRSPLRNHKDPAVVRIRARTFEAWHH